MNVLMIGKTGTSALAEVLRPHLTSGPYWIRLHRHDTRLCDLRPGDKFVFGVRDPVDRFVSAFNSRKRCGRPRFNKPWSPGEARAFGRFASPNELAEALYEDAAADDAMRRIYHLRSSYWYWFVDEAYLRSRVPDLLMVLRQEHLSDDVARLVDLLAISASMPSERVHKNPDSMDSRLSEKAVENLRRWYAKDYEFLDLLASLGLV